MKRILLLVILAVFVSLNAISQQGQVSMIGEFNLWNGDHNMTRDMENPNMWSTYINLVDITETPNDTVEVKFRLDADWAVNWGSADFPSGTATMGGANVLAPKGNYYVTFEFNPADSTATYNFQRTSGNIGMIGEFNLWTGDHEMTRDASDPDIWTTGITLKDITETPDDTVEVKFRQNAEWTYNWGGADFPSGVAVNSGPNIKAPEGSYFVTFEWLNDTTANYTFQKSSGVISMIGEFNGWSADYPMYRLPDNPNMWGAVLHLNADSDDNGNDTVEVKFRQDADWTVSWGGSDFPSGTGTAVNGPNIQVPLNDEADPGITTDYLVLFTWIDDTTCQYTFQLTSGPISMIGAFNNWNGDVMMHRDPLNPQLWKLTRSWYEDSEVKFRENKDWTQAWGNSDWPSGVGNPDNGPNIPLVAGTYDVTFNALTFEYNFVPNNDVCTEIELLGDFNEWGANEDLPPTFMARDADYPSEFTLSYNFTAATNLFFKMSDGQPIGNDNIWGGTFPCGTGMHDVTKLIQVPGGKYDITFNCKSGDFCFTRLGNSVIAPKVFDITVDGKLNEADWDISKNISRIIDGEANDDVNEVNFGVTYKNPDAREGAYLFVGVDVKDAVPYVGDAGEVFIDGDKSGGVYDGHDLRAKFGATGVEILEGPDGFTASDILLGFQITADGYSAEIGIPLDKLGVTPEEGNQMGFDLFYYDDDGEGVAYTLAWNGGLENVSNTSSFGDLTFGELSCGCISVYNSTIGDVILRNPTDMPTNYVGTYEFFDAQDVVFRKDGQSTVEWGAADFPTGTAVIGGPMVPATANRYRVSFDCITGEYNFNVDGTVPEEGLAQAQYTETPPAIDGDLSEYDLAYGSDGVVVGTGPNNNTVTWGAKWDEFNLYIGANVVDGVVNLASVGNPWDNDAIEMYIDGNNDKDGTYDGDFDTQLIMDVVSNNADGANGTDLLWIKADGVPITNYNSQWLNTDDGYAVEIRLGWDNFNFAPGKGRVMGWSLGNNDNDLDQGRDYQTVWYGTGDNWNNTGDLGDLQLAGGPYFFANSISENNVLYNADILLFPNPTNGYVNLKSIGETFKGDVQVMVTDIQGRVIVQVQDSFRASGLVQFNMSGLSRGVYFVNIMGEDGKRAVKKLIVQ